MMTDLLQERLRAKKVRKVALCIYGCEDPVNNEMYISALKQKLGIEVFNAFNPDKWAALEQVAFLKREFECKQMEEFYFSIAIDSSQMELLQYFKFTIAPGTVFFVKGEHDDAKSNVDPAIFWASSLTFDRVCEFKSNMRNIDESWMPRGTSISDKFYFHIKSLFFYTVCVNHENSSLFVGPAQIN